MKRSEELYLAESSKSVAQFAADFETVCKKYDFVLNNSGSMDMARTFADHGADVGPDFDLHMMQVCKPSKAFISMSGNPERSIMMPKFVMAFSRDGKTQIRYLSYSAADISEMIDDESFPASLAETFAKIRSMIDEAR